MEGIERRTVRLAPGETVFPVGQSMTTPEIEKAGRAIEVIGQWLDAPIDVQHAHGLMMALLAGMRTGRESFDAKSLILAMEIAFAGRSGPAFNEAVRRILSGEAGEGISKTFAPSLAELVEATKNVEAGWRNKAARLQRVMAMREREARDHEDRPLTAEEQARVDEVRKLMGGVARSMPRTPMPLPEVKLHGPSPAARVQAEMEARRAGREAGR